MDLTDLLEEIFLFFYVLAIENIYDCSYFLILSIPKHLQDLCPVFWCLGHLAYHLGEARSDKSLLVFELFSDGLVAFLYGLVLRLKPYYKIFNLLLFR